jgi:hypothetical protein
VRFVVQDEPVGRPLLANERAALDALLACDFEGAPELRLQASTAMANGSGLIIDLVTDPSSPQASVTSRIPVEAAVEDEGGVPSNGLILFVHDGRLSALEYWWTTDEMPDAFPPPHRIGAPEPRP